MIIQKSLTEYVKMSREIELSVAVSDLELPRAIAKVLLSSKDDGGFERRLQRNAKKEDTKHMNKEKSMKRLIEPISKAKPVKAVKEEAGLQNYTTDLNVGR